MSRYAYGYSVVPARPRGWRSAAGNFVGVGALVLLSGISGAVVAFDLIGGDARVVPTPVSAAAPARADVAQAPIKLPTKTATQLSTAPRISPVVAPAAESKKPAQRAETPAVVAPVAAPPAAAPAPAQLSQNDDPAISSSDLTFAKGYALRRAAQQAAAAQAQKSAAAHTATPNAKVAAAGEQPGAATERQFGRPAVAKRKPSVVAQYPRGDRYSFERFDGPTRHQALAYGDSSRPVRRSNSGGWFDGLF
ncbi:MAG TPA: hypothetical protein VH249_23235 [Xanthobacteraceae bacterium]|jgi:hypothetical protein|nr:hypothetical protein [Xanthobacteraceae bacterium]